MFDTSPLPISGGLVIGALIYGAVSVFGTGQLVGERMIERSGWHVQCQRRLTQAITDAEPNLAQPSIPDCEAVSGLFGLRSPDLCNMVDVLSAPYRVRQERLRQANRRRIEEAVSKTSSRCACAASLTLEKRRIAFGLHTGSLRLMTPAPVQNLNHELSASLHDPTCRMKE